jgi:uncharacterized protein
VDLTLQGVTHDRRYAFVQAQSRGPFPWLTAREYAGLLRYQPVVEQAPGERAARVTLKRPDGSSVTVDSDELRQELEERSGRALFLLRDYRGNYDVAQVSLISTATIRAIEQRVGAPVEIDRFRANLVVEAASSDGFPEDTWVGRVLRIGDTARIAVTETDGRCMMITLDPETGVARPGILGAVAKLHDTTAGVYASVLTAGPIALGDAVYLE